jgi:MFS family permease
MVLFVFLRPDPYLVARAIAQHHEDGGTDALQTAELPADSAPLGADPRDVADRGVAVGATVMVLTQIAMVAIMTMTPVHMRHHHHSLGDVGFVIGMHIGAMFLPSLVTGRLVDRLGRLPMAVASGVTLLLAGIVAALSPGDSLALLTLALVLLGLGWNLGLISGTTLIVDSTPPTTRARTQGSVDVLIALAGAGGGALSGVIVGVSSYATLSLAGGFLALVLVPVVAWHRHPAVPAWRS